jgi:hypothetical protein
MKISQGASFFNLMQHPGYQCPSLLLLNVKAIDIVLVRRAITVEKAIEKRS